MNTVKILIALTLTAMGLFYGNKHQEEKKNLEKKNTMVAVPYCGKPPVDSFYIKDTEDRFKTLHKANDPTNAYIRRFRKTAIAEMKKYGVPASITLAQGIVETNSGRSAMSKRENNHFGIKCRRGCNCKCATYADDKPNDQFRVFKSAWYSYREHSKLVTSGRYSHLKKHNKDYRKWAKGLKKAGYATHPKYAQMLIAVIERHKLHIYDNM